MEETAEITKSKILVTGATGFLGINLIKELVRRSYCVKGFVQTGVDASPLNDLDIELEYGDLLIPEAVNKAIAGCDIVIHTAAVVDVWPNRMQLHWDVNLNGTKNLIEACKQNNVKKYLHVGSASSIGFGTKENPGIETTPFKGKKYKLDYLDSKKAAQDYVIEQYKNHGFPALVLNPTFMLGGNCTPQGSNSMVLAVVNNTVPGYTSGGKNYVYVRDVVNAIINAIKLGKPGEIYILGNENLSFKEIFTKIAQTTNAKVPKLFMPGFLVKFYGLLSSLISSVTKKAPKVSYTMARMSCEDQYHSAAKAQAELNMPQTPIEEAIKEAYHHYKLTGIIQ